jgi:cytochrome P450 family 4
MLETLRLRPPAPGVDRAVAEDCELKGYKMKKGYNVVLFFHPVHLDPNLWEKPLEFIPERWQKQQEDHLKHPYAFLPFNAGERNCKIRVFRKM